MKNKKSHIKQKKGIRHHTKSKSAHRPIHKLVHKPAHKIIKKIEKTIEKRTALPQSQTQNQKIQDYSLVKEGVIEKYSISIDETKVQVEIKKEGEMIKYELHTPKIEVATTTLLNEIRNELVSVTAITMQELLNPEAFVSMKNRFLEQAKKLIHVKLPKINPDTEKFIVGKLIQDMLGLGEIEYLVNDPSLEEIVITSCKEPVRVYSKKYGWISTNISLDTEEKIVNYANTIARRTGRQITVLEPLLDARLVTGDRVNAVLYPINTKGNTITIRKFSRDPLTVIDLIKGKTCDLETISLIWLAIEYEMNVLISGGTASGKTSFLNACMPFIPPNQRIISIEDTRELMLPEFLYWTPLVTRTPNTEGKGEVSMLHLLINSLRMRPDRIILGEMRKHEEAMVLFEAMHTGHSVYATVHADSAAETISRLVNPPLNVPPNLLKTVDLNIVMFRDRKRGIRRVLQVSEFEQSGEGVEPNILFRWSAETDEMVRHSENTKFMEKLNRLTGMSEKEIIEDLKQKKKILETLVNQNIRSLEEVGSIIGKYYRNKDSVIKSINKNEISSLLKK